MIKSFTGIEQSKKLAEFLPLESADMHYFNYGNITKPYVGFDVNETRSEKNNEVYEYIPCWSLAALLNVLPKNLNIGCPSLASNYMGYYWLQYYDEYMRPNNYKTECLNNPVDACYEMIIRLNELDLL